MPSGQNKPIPRWHIWEWHVLSPCTWRVIFKMKNWYRTDTVTIYPAWDRLRECRCPGSTINNSLSRSVSYFSMVTSHVQTWALDIFFPLKGALSSTHFSKWHYNSIQFFKNGARLWVSPLKYVPGLPTSLHCHPLVQVSIISDLCSRKSWPVSLLSLLPPPCQPPAPPQFILPKAARVMGWKDKSKPVPRLPETLSIASLGI